MSNFLINSWSGKLATASDPYFQNPPTSPMTSPQLSQPPVSVAPLLDVPDVSISVPDSSASSPPTDTDTAPSTPDSISTALALEIEEYIDFLEAEDEEDRYTPDPGRRKRDLEINERVNVAIAAAEEAALAREILSPRVEPRKTVQFAAENQTRIVEDYNGAEDYGNAEIIPTTVYIWNTFRDFATARSITGFEEFVLEPRIVRKSKPSVADKKIGTEKSEDTVRVEEKGDKRDKTVENALIDVPKVESTPSSTNDVAAPVVIPTPAPASAPMPVVISPPQTATNILTSAPEARSDVLSPAKPPSPPIQGGDCMLIPVATTNSTPTPVPAETSHNIQPTPHVPKWSPSSNQGNQSHYTNQA